MEKRLFGADATNVEVRVTSWGVYVDGKGLEDIIKEKVAEGTFRAKVHISIQEVEEGLSVFGNKPKEEDVDGEAEDI